MQAALINTTLNTAIRAILTSEQLTRFNAFLSLFDQMSVLLFL